MPWSGQFDCIWQHWNLSHLKYFFLLLYQKPEIDQHLLFLFHCLIELHQTLHLPNIIASAEQFWGVLI